MNKETALVPVNKVKRPPCPFYGFYKTGSIFMDQEGNQCPLILNSYSPCQMEIDRINPDWEKCLLNNPKFMSQLEKFAEVFLFFPREFSEGILFKDWKNYVMSKKG